MGNDLNERHEAVYRKACDAAGLAAFQHPAEAMELMPAETTGDVMAQLAVVLSPLFGFIARGHLGGTLDMRAWCVLYCLRAEYVRGETIAEYAKRRGVTPRRVQVLINELRTELPALRSPHAKSVAHVAAMRAAHRAGTSGVAPGGKESFTGTPERLGSARQLISPRED
jgi:hypothetical protein